MRLQPIINQLSIYLPFATDLFTDTLDIVSASQFAGTATIITATNHNLSVSQSIVISDVVTNVVVSSMTFDSSNDELTVRTVTDHGLTEGFDYQLRAPTNEVMVTLEGQSEPEYSGKFLLKSVPNRFAFIVQLLSTPINPPSQDGFVIRFASNFFTGVQVITNIVSTTEFEFDINPDSPELTTDSGFIHSNWRISGAADLARANDSYTKQVDDEYWLFVTPGNSFASKDRNILNDAVLTLAPNHQEYRQREVDNINIYVFVPTTNDIGGRQASDNLENIKIALFKAMLRFTPPSIYNITEQFALVYNNSQIVEYNSAYIIKEFVFQCCFDITYPDSFSSGFYAPFRDIEAQTVINTQNLLWDVNLDVDPDF